MAKAREASGGLRGRRPGSTWKRSRGKSRRNAIGDERRRSVLRDIFAGASVVAAFTAVGASLWVGKTTSDVADDTRRDAIVAQRAEQFASATTQLASPIQDVQLGAIYSLESLVMSEATTYGSRGCDMIRAFIDSRAVRKFDDKTKVEGDIAVIGALNVAGRACQAKAGMDFKDLLLSGARLPGATLTKLSLTGADLTRADLTGANLDGANIRGADLTQASLASASLKKAALTKVTLVEAQMVESDLSGSDLSAANMNQANLSRARLEGVSANADTQLVGARISGANLRNSHLRGVSFRAADLRGADLRNANLARCDLRGANLAGAILLHADLAEVRYDATTSWPQGFAMPAVPAAQESPPVSQRTR